MGEREKILLVDDSDSLLEGLTTFLVVKGHEVVATAKSVEKVKTYLQKNPADITVAIVDNKMPNEGDGKIAATLIKESLPNVTIISLAGDLQDWGHINIQKGFDASDELEIALKNL